MVLNILNTDVAMFLLMACGLYNAKIIKRKDATRRKQDYDFS